MNIEQLKELQDRAHKATKLATEISNLQDATSNQLKWNGFLEKELAIEAFNLGKAELLKRKEAELAELLGEESRTEPSMPLPPIVLPDDQFIGTLDSSDMWEQPAEPAKC